MRQTFESIEVDHKSVPNGLTERDERERERIIEGKMLPSSVRWIHILSGLAKNHLLSRLIGLGILSDPGYEKKKKEETNEPLAWAKVPF